MSLDSLAADVAREFEIPSDVVSVRPYGGGHINDTYEIRCDQPARYVLQRINPNVFRDPAGLMSNVSRVIAHLRMKLEQSGADDVSRRVLTLVPARSGQLCHFDADGCCWRVYRFVEGAVAYEVLSSSVQAEELARTYGHFQQILLDLPGPLLKRVIPGFHNARDRFESLLHAIEIDACNRAADVQSEIAFALRREKMVDVLSGAFERGEIPERITHNDTKVNNVLFDETTGKGVCVIDLDTVMPGLTLYDFGDMVRTAASTAPEDEQNLSRMSLSRANFEALARGYWQATRTFLTPNEKSHLTFAGKLMSFVTGVRFLTDYLAGDTYYKTRRRGQNLDRCRTQFKLVQCLEEHEEEMATFVEQLQ